MSNRSNEKLGSADSQNQSFLSEQLRQSRRDLARQRLNLAFSQQISKDAEDAKQTLADAVRTDPDLVNDQGAIGLACHLYGVEKGRAVALLHEQSQQPLDEAKYRPKVKFGEEFWATVLEFLVLFVILLVFSAVMYLFILQIADKATLPGSASTSSERMTLGLSLLRANPLGISLRYGILWMASVLIGLTLMYMIGSLLGGTGEVGSVIRSLGRLCMVAFVVATIGVVVVLTASRSGGDNTDLIAIGAWIVYIAIGASLFLMSLLMARVHRTGFYKGLAAVFLGGVSAGVAAVLFGAFRP